MSKIELVTEKQIEYFRGGYYYHELKALEHHRTLTQYLKDNNLTCEHCTYNINKNCTLHNEIKPIDENTETCVDFKLSELEYAKRLLDYLAKNNFTCSDCTHTQCKYYTEKSVTSCTDFKFKEGE